MKSVRLFAMFIACLVAWAATQEKASAQSVGPYCSSGFAYPGWMGYYGSPYSLGQIPTPPYFALHPPVYYSLPVARSYGYSPYAYPGEMQTPDVVMPEVIENPHVEQKPAGQVKEVKTVRYQIIENPFVRNELKSRRAAQLATNRSEARP